MSTTRKKGFRFPLAQEARVELTLASIALGATALLWVFVPTILTAVVTFVTGLLWLGLIFFFRDPERASPSDREIYLSPADGKVMEILVTEERSFLEGLSIKIAVFMSLSNVHVNRSPIEGTVELIRHVPGRFLQAFRPEASEVNEHQLIGLSRDGERVLVKQIAGILARRIVCSVHESQRLTAGQRLGLIKFGSRVEIYLPPDSEVIVDVGDRVVGGITPLARSSNPSPGVTASST